MFVLPYRAFGVTLFDRKYQQCPGVISKAHTRPGNGGSSTTCTSLLRRKIFIDHSFTEQQTVTRMCLNPHLLNANVCRVMISHWPTCICVCYLHSKRKQNSIVCEHIKE